MIHRQINVPLLSTTGPLYTRERKILASTLLVLALIGVTCGGVILSETKTSDKVCVMWALPGSISAVLLSTSYVIWIVWPFNGPLLRRLWADVILYLGVASYAVSIMAVSEECSENEDLKYGLVVWVAIGTFGLLSAVVWSLIRLFKYLVAPWGIRFDEDAQEMSGATYVDEP
jgi:hypothetical protein